MVQACTRWSGWRLHADCPQLGGGVSWGNMGCTALFTHGEHTYIVEDRTMQRCILGLLVTLALTLSICVAPLAAAAKQPAHVPRIAFLGYNFPPAASEPSPFLDAFRQGLRERGWVEGNTIAIEWRWAEGSL